jgi:RNA polymerase sigma-70 factor (ECF subfamily)
MFARRHAQSPTRSAAAEGASDEELVSVVAAGDSAKYAVLVGRYQERLYRHALGMTFDSDVAADLVQDAFVKAYTSLATCRDPARFGSWVFQILRNGCLDYLKSRRRKDVSLEDQTDLACEAAGPETDLERLTLREELERALGMLPPAQREAFLLKHVHDLSYEEMAEVVDASVSALRMRVLRAREMLQTLLDVEISSPAGQL